MKRTLASVAVLVGLLLSTAPAYAQQHPPGSVAHAVTAEVAARDGIKLS